VFSDNPTVVAKTRHSRLKGQLIRQQGGNLEGVHEKKGTRLGTLVVGWETNQRHQEHKTANGEKVKREKKPKKKQPRSDVHNN